MNIVITGANRGIGLELTRRYAKDNHVYALCRQSSTELNLLPNVTVIDECDVSSTDSIIRATSLCPPTIDILINNAGILRRVSLESLNEDLIYKQFDINAVGPLRVTNAFLNSLKKDSKIILITSRMGSIDDNSSGSHYGYRMSKAALNMAGKSMAIDLNSQGICVGIIHPGWVKTDMTGQTGHYSVDVAAEQIISRIDELNMSNSGSFWHSDGSELPW